MSLLHHIQFTNPDPLGGGLAEEIAAEQSEPEAIILEEFENGQVLSEQWTRITQEASDDADWYVLADEEGAE